MLRRYSCVSCAWLAVLVWFTSTAALGQGEHGRRAGAELRVIAGDAARLEALTASGADTEIIQGLADRVRGGLSAIDILLRLADQEAGRQPLSYRQQVQKAYVHTDAREWPSLGRLLTGLMTRFPLLQPEYPDSAVLLESARQMHQSFCAGCHDTPVRGVSRPAYNLYRQAVTLPALEFYARMLVGVRGDRVTGIDNPLSDYEIAGLIALYRSQGSGLSMDKKHRRHGNPETEAD